MNLVFLVSCLTLWPSDPEYQVIEMFAGVGRICRLAKAVGLSACAHDISFDGAGKGESSCFDIVGTAGFVLLVVGT